MERNIAHLNIIGFRSAIAALEDSSLRGRPYVIASFSGAGGRAIAWDVSPEAIKQGIKTGMYLHTAQRLIKDLLVLSPNPPAYHKANKLLEDIVNKFAPAWQNDGKGNIFLDISGTRRLFGPPADCICRIQHEIMGKVGVKTAMAAASNKLVGKVASRAIRPAGLIEVRPGNEAAFLSRQNIGLLPGIGQKLQRILTATGFRDIGEIAALSDTEALSLFGKEGLVLRNNALGIDTAPVEGGRNKTIWRRADFPEDLIEYDRIRAALSSLVSYGGFELRNEKLSVGRIKLGALYSDGVEAEAAEKPKEALVLDRDIFHLTEKLYKKAVDRRIRIRSLYISFEDLSPLEYQPDLFEIETNLKENKLQLSLDSIHGRYGQNALKRGLSLSPVPEAKTLPAAKALPANAPPPGSA